MRSEADYAVRALACGYPARVRAKKLMVALRAFVDDSASEKGDRRLFLAGYINTIDRWEAFSNEWDKVLKAHPSIDYFKMAEAQNLRDQFGGWSDVDRDQKVLALAAVIRDHDMRSVHCSVSREEYSRILAPRAPAALNNPYFSCFWGIIVTAAHYHQSLGVSDTPPVDFVFDEQGGLGDEAVIWYRWLKESQDPAIRDLLGATPIFLDDKNVVALQAADMLAWHLRRAHETGETEHRPAINMLARHHAARDIDVATLTGMASRMGRVPGVSLAQHKAEWKRQKKVLAAHVAAGAPPPKAGLIRLYVLNAVARARMLMARFRRRRRS